MNPKDPSQCWLHVKKGICKPHGINTVLFEIISTLNVPVFMYIEACTIKGCGQWGWLDFW